MASRDHMFGWPASLLALDPVPRTSLRTSLRPRLTTEEESKRCDEDARLTLAYAAGAALKKFHDIEPKPEVFTPQYYRGDSGTIYRTTNASGHAKGERFRRSTRRWEPTVTVTNSEFVKKLCYHPIARPPEIPE